MQVMSESGFEVTRRILVDFEGISLRRKFLSGVEPENIHMMIGTCPTLNCQLHFLPTLYPAMILSSSSSMTLHFNSNEIRNFIEIEMSVHSIGNMSVYLWGI